MKGDTKTGIKLQQKADNEKDKKIIEALKKADIKGLSREKAKEKLDKIVDNIQKQ